MAPCLVAAPLGPDSWPLEPNLAFLRHHPVISTGAIYPFPHSLRWEYGRPRQSLSHHLPCWDGLNFPPVTYRFLLSELQGYVNNLLHCSVYALARTTIGE